MGLEFQSEVAVLGKFGEACEGSLLDWRKKCEDEIVMRIPMVLVDQFYSNLPYFALTKSETSINFREAWESEGGTSNPNCCPSTANAQTEICEFRLPELKQISIGTEPQCYQDLRKRLCRRYPIFKKCSPFRVVNGQVQTLDRLTGDGTQIEASRTFSRYINSELSQAIWDHLYRTAWVGRNSKVDSFNAIFYYLENGIEDLKVTDCDYPTKPFTLNWTHYILGTASYDAGVYASPGDVVLAVDDPNRPGDAPANNIITIHQGTSCETTLDITGFDLIDVFTAWYEYITNEWGVNVLSWLLGVPRNKFRCFAEVSACKSACQFGDCRELLVADSRDMERANRQADFVANRLIDLWPYPVRIPMYQSPALSDTNKVLFIPETFVDMEGETTSWLLWAWLNQRQENESMFADVPALREALGLTGARLDNFDGEIYDGSEFNFAPGPLVDATVWDWLWDRNCNAIQWWNNAETGMIPQCPHLWLVVDGVDCSKTITLECCDWPTYPEQYTITDCTDDVAPQGYTSAMTFTYTDDGASNYELGDAIDYMTAVGTTYRGIVLAFTSGTPDSTVQIGFVDDNIDCATEGGAVGGDIRTAIGA